MPAKINVSVEALVAAYERTRSIDKVGPECGISRTTAKRRLREAGIVFDGPKTIDPDRPSKLCPACDTVKPADAFHRANRRPDGRQGICKVCAAAGGRGNQLQIKYGITATVYAEMLAEQGGVCAICGLPETIMRAGRVMQLSVDHCHTTTEVRGLLCSDCNNGLGRFKDDPELLLRAAAYLKGD